MRTLKVMSWDKLRQEYHQERLRKQAWLRAIKEVIKAVLLGDVGWSTDRGHAGSVEGIMDLVEFTNWLVPRVIGAGGVLLMVMAVSQIF